jgi:hypothetical protein
MAYEHGKITNEGIAVRERIGKASGRQPWRTEVSRDTIWHLAQVELSATPTPTRGEEHAGASRSARRGAAASTR